MENKFTKSKIITISIIAAIIVLGVLFYKINSNTPNNDTENTIIDKVIDSADTTKTETAKQKVTDGSIKNDTNLVNTENDKSFSASVKNAQLAFGKNNFGMAIDYYNQALKYKTSDTAYSGMFNVYSAQQSWIKAGEMLDKAISLNPLNSDYWKWKLTLMDERTSASFSDLKKVYEEGLNKSLPKTRINLVIHFAQIATANNQKDEAISLWKKAIELYPAGKEIYQSEIDQLNKS